MTGNRLKNALLLMLVAAPPFLLAQAPIRLVIVDPPGIGFNDPTPAAPTGNNTATTVGQQRLMALKYAAAIWSSRLESPVPIRVRARFDSLPCSAKTATLAAASPTSKYATATPHPEFLANVWYPAALANRISETVLDPDNDEIAVTFNPDLGQSDCLPGGEWYYGLDDLSSPTQADMVATALHELAHGLGFTPLPGSGFSKDQDKGDVFSQYLLDTSTGKTWNQMSNSERAASALNTRALVWSGINVAKDVPKVLHPGALKLRISEPAAIAGDYYVAPAAFGSPLTATGVSGRAVVALDEANADGPSTTDACSPILNSAELQGRIAVVDRGTCNFAQKARAVQAAGAIGLIVVNNVEGSFPIYVLGTDPAVKIPLVHVTLADGNTIKKATANFQSVTVNLLADPDVLAGADREGRPLLYNPDPAQTSASICHWDPSTTPNQLMEPDVAPDLSYSVESPKDLTLALLRDLGWFSDFDGVPDGIDQCPGSDRSETVVIQGCNSHLPNITFATGCKISDYLKPCEALPANSGALATCVASVSARLVRSGKIPARQSSKLQACTVRSAHP